MAVADFYLINRWQSRFQMTYKVWSLFVDLHKLLAASLFRHSDVIFFPTLNFLFFLLLLLLIMIMIIKSCWNFNSINCTIQRFQAKTRDANVQWRADVGKLKELRGHGQVNGSDQIGSDLVFLIFQLRLVVQYVPFFFFFFSSFNLFFLFFGWSWRIRMERTPMVFGWNPHPTPLLSLRISCFLRIFDDGLKRNRIFCLAHGWVVGSDRVQY